MKHILIFHPVIAPYRIDFFNDIYIRCNASIYQIMKRFGVFNNYEKISSQFEFEPQYVFETGDEHNGRLFRTKYWDVIKREKPDIVVTFEFGACPIMVILYKFLFSKKFKIVTTCDDSADMINNASLRHRLFRRICSKFIDDVITVNPEVNAWFQKNYKKGIYFPIIRDENKARSKYNELLELSNKLAKNNKLYNTRTFGFVGRLDPEKNVGLLIRSFAKVCTKDDTLLIIGSGKEEGKLKQLAASLSIKAVFVGRVEGDELMAWYNVIDVFVLPSTFEPFGAVTNEALLAGCYSIISTIAGSKCLIKEGINGSIFDPYKNDSLVENMSEAQKRIPCHSDCIYLKANLMNESYNVFLKNLVSRLNTL